MITRKLWHLVPKKIREYISDTTGVQARYLRWNIRNKSKRLRNLKGVAAGKRCFIVGNGPSLTVEDLERIQNEDSFACNYIFRIFKDHFHIYFFSIIFAKNWQNKL